MLQLIINIALGVALGIAVRSLWLRFVGWQWRRAARARFISPGRYSTPSTPVAPEPPSTHVYDSSVQDVQYDREGVAINHTQLPRKPMGLVAWTLAVFAGGVALLWAAAAVALLLSKT
jgi:hypothetical protein